MIGPMRSSVLRRSVVVVFVLLHLCTSALEAARVCCNHDAMVPECCRNAGADHVCPFTLMRDKAAGRGAGHHGMSHDNAMVHGPGTGHGATHGHDADVDSDGPLLGVPMSCGVGHDAGVPPLGYPGLPQAETLISAVFELERPPVLFESVIALSVTPSPPPPKA